MFGNDQYVHAHGGAGLIAADLISSIQAKAREHALEVTTDQVPLGAGGGLLPLDADVLEQMTRSEGWNDKPMIDRVLEALIATGRKKQKPESTTTRLLVVVPTVMEVHIVVAFGFTPVSASDAGDVRKSGLWTLSYSVRGGAPVNGQGDFIRGREDLNHMMVGLFACFAALQEEFKLAQPQAKEEPISGIDWSKVPGSAIGPLHVGPGLQQ